jgi:transposase-like protein
MNDLKKHKLSEAQKMKASDGYESIGKNIIENVIRELVKKDGITAASGGLYSLIKEVMAITIDTILLIELEENLGYKRYDYKNKSIVNARNGFSSKHLKTSCGIVVINVPRDRNGEFVPKFLSKYQNKIKEEIENGILAIFKNGMSVESISDHIKAAYKYNVSESTLAKIMERILPIIRNWQSRTLKATYAAVILDVVGLLVHAGENSIKKPAYIAVGVDLDGNRDVIGVWECGNESIEFWTNHLNELKARGVENILVICANQLDGFEHALQVVYPNTDFQKE